MRRRLWCWFWQHTYNIVLSTDHEYAIVVCDQCHRFGPWLRALDHMPVRG